MFNLFFCPQEYVALKEQLLRELDMYQEIAVAKGADYDFLNQKMDNCQENIETLSDEIQRLQGTIELFSHIFRRIFEHFLRCAFCTDPQDKIAKNNVKIEREICFSACLADEELKAEEESIEELRRRAEEDAIRVQLEAHRREEERRIREEQR